MLHISRMLGLAAMLGGVTPAISAQAPVLRGHPLPNGRIGIQFPLSPIPIAPLPSDLAAPPSRPTKVQGAFGTACSPPTDPQDQSGDSKMVVRGGGPGLPPVPMP